MTPGVEVVMSTRFCCSRAGLPNLSSIDILDKIILCYWRLCALWEVQQHPWMLPARYQQHLSSCAHQKYFQTLSNAPRGKNHLWLRITDLESRTQNPADNLQLSTFSRTASAIKSHLTQNHVPAQDSSHQQLINEVVQGLATLANQYNTEGSFQFQSSLLSQQGPSLDLHPAHLLPQSTAASSLSFPGIDLRALLNKHLAF